MTVLRAIFTAEIIAALRLSALGRWWAERAARRLSWAAGRRKTCGKVSRGSEINLAEHEEAMRGRSA
ncbi:hypothetical protein [Albimonas pacifica]|uniref:hypothetical protein n=1 Tax=Albimonas pacifica TaxID=1114924 RepID=UPI001160C440|nr:hypothetical protein [Albimonas pacifica]